MFFFISIFSVFYIILNLLFYHIVCLLCSILLFTIFYLQRSIFYSSFLFFFYFVLLVHPSILFLSIFKFYFLFWCMDSYPYFSFAICSPLRTQAFTWKCFCHSRSLLPLLFQKLIFSIHPYRVQQWRTSLQSTDLRRGAQIWQDSSSDVLAVLEIMRNGHCDHVLPECPGAARAACVHWFLAPELDRANPAAAAVAIIRH